MINIISCNGRFICPNTLIDINNVEEKRKQHQRVRLMGDIEIKSFRLLLAQLKTAITSPFSSFIYPHNWSVDPLTCHYIRIHFTTDINSIFRHTGFIYQ